MHFSNFFNLGINGHEDIDYVDVNLKTDIKLFIDPYIIESRSDSFSKECAVAINSFFESIFDCCRSNDNDKLMELLDFAHEPNETKLGLSRNQSRGKGASSEILFKIFKDISEENLIVDRLIENPMDVCLFAGNFAEDRMSDLITNVLRKKLHDFTKLQCNKHNIPLGSTKEIIGSYWNPDTLSWETLEDYPLKSADRTLLLVPKIFVTTKYMYSVAQYLQHKILNQRQIYHQTNETSLAKMVVDKFGNKSFRKPSKKDIYAAEVKGTKRKHFIQKYSRENPEALIDFRESMGQQALFLGVTLSDEALNIIVYKRLPKAS
jgi:hypothetical protein